MPTLQNCLPFHFPRGIILRPIALPLLAVSFLCLSACTPVTVPELEGEVPNTHFTNPETAAKAVALRKDAAEAFRQRHISRRAVTQAKSFQLTQSIRAWKSQGDEFGDRDLVWVIVQDLRQMTANCTPRGFTFKQLPIAYEDLTPETATAQNEYLKIQLAEIGQDLLGQSSQISSHRFKLETSIDEWSKRQNDRDIANFMRTETNKHFVTLYHMIEKFKPLPLQ